MERNEFWSKRIKTYLVALELRYISSDYVEDETRRNKLRELKKNDAKVIFALN